MPSPGSRVIRKLLVMVGELALGNWAG